MTAQSIYCVIPTVRKLPEHIRSVEAMRKHCMQEGQPIDIARDDSPPTDADPKQDLLNRLMRIRELFLASDADVLLLIEDDIVVPEHAAVMLAAATVGTHVAYGFDVCRQPPHRWSMSMELRANGWNEAPRPHLMSQEEAAELVQKHEVYVSGCGLFCTAIPRGVVRRIPFRREPPHHADLAFALDCIKHGVVQNALPSVICGHITDDAILYPNTLATGAHYRAEQREG